MLIAFYILKDFCLLSSNKDKLWRFLLKPYGFNFYII